MVAVENASWCLRALRFWLRTLQALCLLALALVVLPGRAYTMQALQAVTLGDKAATLRSAQLPLRTVAVAVAAVQALLRPLSEVPVVAKDQKGVQLPHQASTVLAGAVMVQLRQGLILLAAEVVVVGAPLVRQGLLVCMQLMVVSVVLVLAV